MGRKKFYMICVALFTVCSFLCGIAITFPPHRRAHPSKARAEEALAPASRPSSPTPSPSKSAARPFAVYGMAVVVAPAIGPTLGGWITDNFKLALDLLHQHPLGPHLALTSATEWWKPAAPQAPQRAGQAPQDRLHGPRPRHPRLGCLEFTSQRPERKTWFGDPMIRTFAILAAATLIFFILVGVAPPPTPSSTSALKKNRNFGTASSLQLSRHGALRLDLCSSHPPYFRSSSATRRTSAAWFSPPPASS